MDPFSQKSAGWTRRSLSLRCRPVLRPVFLSVRVQGGSGSFRAEVPVRPRERCPAEVCSRAPGMLTGSDSPSPASLRVCRCPEAGRGKSVSGARPPGRFLVCGVRTGGGFIPGMQGPPPGNASPRGARPVKKRLTAARMFRAGSRGSAGRKAASSPGFRGGCRVSSALPERVPQTASAPERRRSPFGFLPFPPDRREFEACLPRVPACPSYGCSFRM